ncbi:MAG: hypothetical protein Kow0062_28660 [Acidobacteriota bacterium]
MRIVHVCQATTRGGLLRVAETLACMQRKRHEVAFASPLVPGADELIAAHWPHGIDGNRALRALRALRRRVADWRADAVIIHAGSPGEGAFAPLILRRRWTVAIVEHAPDVFPLARPLRDRVLFAIKRRADLWAAVSRAGARSIARRAGVPEARIAVLENGVPAPPDIPPGDASLRLPFEAGPVLLGAGRPDAIKGFDLFVAAARELASRHPALRFLWVGGERAFEAEPVRVVPFTDRLGWMIRRARAVVIPSRAEGLPALLLEAWAVRTPVLAARVGGIPELTERLGDDRWTFAPEDPPRIAAAAEALLSDERLGIELAERGHALWQERYTPEAMAQRWEDALTHATAS